MRISSWFQLCMVASGLAVSSYACGGDGDDANADPDGGTSGNTSGQNGSSSSSSGGASSGGSSSSSGGASSGGSSSGGSSSSGSSSSSGGSSSGSTEEDAGPDAAADADAGSDAGSDAGEEVDASDGGVVVVEPAGSVQYLGRWGDLNDDDLDDGPTTSWPGSKVVLKFHGTGVTAVIGQTGAQSGGKSRYDIIVDGIDQPRVSAGETAALVIANGSATYTLAAGLAEGDHTLVLFRRTEPQQGVNNFKSFTIGGANPKLLAPPARPVRYLEVLTESTTNGYGLDSTVVLPALADSRSCGGDVSIYNNARRSFPNKLAERFGAELSLLGMSAIGITANAGGNTAYKFATFYPRINPLSGGDAASNTWAYAAHPADVVLILLGGADFDDPDGKGGVLPHITTAEGFSPDLDNLVGMARARNPLAHIFMMVGPQIKDSYPSVAKGWPAAQCQQRTKLHTAMVAVRNGRAADPKLYVYDLTEINDGDHEMACSYHGSENLHTEMANQADDWIAAATGWALP